MFFQTEGIAFARVDRTWIDDGRTDADGRTQI